MARGLLLLACVYFCECFSYGQGIRIVDEQGVPVERFQAMYHTAEHGYGQWEHGNGGSWSLASYVTRRTPVLDVLVRAEGYASAFRRFKGQSREDLLQSNATVRIAKGRQVVVRLNLPEGLRVPDDFLPEIYFSAFAWRVRAMWQPANRRSVQSDFNQLNVRNHEAGAFSFRLADDVTEFYIAFQHPGWLRFYEVGPLTNVDVVDGTLSLDVPKPAGLEVRFDTGRVEEELLPFSDVYCEVMWQPPGAGKSVYLVTDHNQRLEDDALRITDLAPGTYIVLLRTEPEGESARPVADTEINPGRFFARREVELMAGGTAQAVISFVPFDADAHKGAGNARVTVLLSNGDPAAGKPLKIRWGGGHYGQHVIVDQPVPKDGIVHLRGVSLRASDAPFGPYSISVGDETLGFFRLKQTKEVQDFEFRIVPKVGDVAPELAFLDVRTKERRRLTDFRGKIVLIEFWATWCGPCQPAMGKLKELFTLHQADWKDQVSIVPLSIDESIVRVEKHIASRGWGGMPQYWAEREEGQYFTNAQLAYAVYGVPAAVLIDASGTIAWRGHPIQADDGKDLAARIKSLQAK